MVEVDLKTVILQLATLERSLAEARSALAAIRTRIPRDNPRARAELDRIAACLSADVPPETAGSGRALDYHDLLRAIVAPEVN